MAGGQLSPSDVLLIPNGTKVVWEGFAQTSMNGCDRGGHRERPWPFLLMLRGDDMTNNVKLSILEPESANNGSDSFVRGTEVNKDNH